MEYALSSKGDCEISPTARYSTVQGGVAGICQHLYMVSLSGRCRQLVSESGCDVVS